MAVTHSFFDPNKSAMAGSWITPSSGLAILVSVLDKTNGPFSRGVCPRSSRLLLSNRRSVLRAAVDDPLALRLAAESREVLDGGRILQGKEGGLDPGEPSCGEDRRCQRIELDFELRPGWTSGVRASLERSIRMPLWWSNCAERTRE